MSDEISFTAVAEKLLNSQKPTALLLMGPTASGKTALAQALCDVLPCQIINVDSAQFYRQMNIGSAKPDAQELARYPHRMIDFLDPSETYSVGRFREEVLVEIKTVIDEQKIPLLVGGSMMYFKVLVDGINDLPASDLKLRERLERVQKYKGLSFLYNWLLKVDFATAQRLHPNDPQRILRALEVFLQSGEKLSDLHQCVKLSSHDICAWQPIILFPQQRELLHLRIARRFQMMLDEGFAVEVEKLFWRSDLSLDKNPALRAVGYRQMWEYLEGAISYENMRERGIIATRQFAKRQYTWLRSWLSAERSSVVFDNSEVLAATQRNDQQQLLLKLRNDVLASLKNSI